MDTRVAGTAPARKTRKTRTMKKLALTGALAVPAALILAATVSAGPGSAAGNGDDPNAPGVGTGKLAAASASASTCDGTVQKRVVNRGTNGWVYAGSDTGALVLPGTAMRFQGPSTGSDVINVNLSAQSYLSPGSTGYVKVLMDGIPIRPSDSSFGTSFYDSGTGYGTFAQNYCRKIGPGYHDFRVEISDNDGGQTGNYYFELKDAMVHIQRSE